MARGTILLVDDSPLTLQVVRGGLEARGFAVRSVSDLADVPRPLLASEIDLVLVDVEMAEVFGDELAMVLRSDVAGPPIYLLSAIEPDELAERAAAAGVDGFIHKRAGVDEVVRKVEAILGVGSATGAGDHRRDVLPLFFATFRRRARHARAALRIGGRDNLRHAAYELHAMVGEAAVLGYAEIAELAQQGRHAAARCLEAPGPDASRGCEDLLSAIEQQVEALAEHVALPHRIDASARPAAGLRVLLLDDSDLYRATLAAILEDHGYQVAEAASLAECRALLASASSELVIVDVELGDGSGIDLIPAIREVMPTAAVVVLSGGDVRVVPDGADLVLLKTLDPTSVLSKLERVLSERRG